MMMTCFLILLAGKYACSSGNQCVARLNVCDGIQHCRDGSDESHCLRNKKRRRKNKHKKYKHSKHGKYHNMPINESFYDPLLYTTPSHQDIFTINKKHYTTKYNDIKKYEQFTIQRDTTELHEDQSYSTQGVVEDEHKNKEDEKIKMELHDVVPTSEILPSLEQDPTAEITNKVTRSLKSLNLKVYPSNQEVYETGDVVIQCRDEGELRVDVYWEKATGKKDSKSSKLPHGAYDYNGRLEMSRILPHEGGNYICRAVGHENEAGSEVLATVKVLKLP